MPAAGQVSDNASGGDQGRTANTTSSKENPLIGAVVQVHPPPDSAAHPPDSTKAAPATVLDVKRLQGSDALLAFVQWREMDRRFAQWVPLTCITPESMPAGVSVEEASVPVTALGCYAPIGDDLRAGFKTTMDFLEERLKRDMQSPNSVRRLLFAGRSMLPWYYSPFDTLYPAFTPSTGTLHDAHICPVSLTPFPSAAALTRHLHGLVRSGAPLRVPGREIYCDADAGLSIMEVSGTVHTVFCRNVFLLAKCFLECKLVGHDTDLYTMYVVAIHARKRLPGYFAGLPDSCDPMVFAGYYSYEDGSVHNNLACIVTLPCFQGHGLGRFLIEASYAIGYRKGILGSPERPLTDFGQAAYDRYWGERVWRWALEHAVEAVEQRRPVQPGAYDAPPSLAGEERKTGGLATMRVTVHEVAKALRLDPGDVLDTVVRLGLVHRTEGKSLTLLVPVDVAKREVARVAVSPSPFKEALLGDLLAAQPVQGSGSKKTS